MLKFVKQKLFSRRKKSPLEHLQDRLNMLLYSGIKSEQIKEILLQDPILTEYKSYISAMDEDMLRVGAELTRKWGAPEG